MNLIFLTQQGGILGPFAKIMGVILNAIYETLSLIGIQNIAICIVLFTFVIKMLMLPITIKQQKFSKLSSKMNPELTKIQAKYKNKKDQDSVRRQQAELQEVYQKYGANPMSGCLPMIITLPILFALFRVIYAVPAYITDINALYAAIADKVNDITDYTELIKEFVKENREVAQVISGFKEENYTITHLIDIFSKFNPENWKAFFEVGEFSSLSFMQVDIGSHAMLIHEVVSKITHAHSFLFGLSILELPGWGFPGIIIPIIAMAFNFVQSKLMTTSTKTDIDNPAAQSMKTMNTIMPIVSGVFCVFVPIGVGIYWIAGSIFQIFQQLFVNRHMDRIDLDEMIEKNIEKSNKRKQRLGIDTGNKMASVAKASTKSIEAGTITASSKKRPEESPIHKKSEVSYNAGSIADIANIMKNKNKEKGDR